MNRTHLKRKAKTFEMKERICSSLGILFRKKLSTCIQESIQKFIRVVSPLKLVISLSNLSFPIQFFKTLQGSTGVLEEECYVKDAISRVLVEVIKHEWPTKWKTLLGDLYKLGEQGVSLVL